ncbi:hypothetical protein [Rhizobium sullae]|uniref:Uncharacterized protein n=1 Tax=Rhizobium sullae TaxID=50338 RepID=A0A4R3Q7N7_RHISU|nr:hypothetical protein [Rhizobium sullae]TCU13956.1 hypothetical protein EV132_11033 [Rhizobium sullae]
MRKPGTIAAIAENVGPWITCSIGFAANRQACETVVLLIFSRSDIARTESPCSCVSLKIDRMSFTSISLAYFRLAIHRTSFKSGQNGRDGAGESRSFDPEKTVRDLPESVSAN